MQAAADVRIKKWLKIALLIGCGVLECAVIHTANDWIKYTNFCNLR